MTARLKSLWWVGVLPLFVFICSLLACDFYFPSLFASRSTFLWCLFFAFYAGSKWATWWHRTVEPSAKQPSAWRHIAYCFFWLGMDADAFLATHPKGVVPQPLKTEWLAAIGSLCLGAGLFFFVAPQLVATSPLWACSIALAGLAFLLLLGFFACLSCGFRQAGIQAKPVMNSIFTPTQLSNFWGARWNMAFHDITTRYIFQPLLKKTNLPIAFWGSFLYSGLIHEIVISVPAQSGYGGPTIYFLIQAVGITIQRSSFAKQSKWNQGVIGWFFCAAFLLLPISFLFPIAFCQNVILPMLLF